jgi:hypothetical protein
MSHKIDWQAIRSLGEEGMLTGEETAALCRLAEARVICESMVVCDDRLCPFCYTEEHGLPMCPIQVLERVDSDR